MFKFLSCERARARFSGAGAMVVSGLHGLLLVLAASSWPIASVEAAGKDDRRATRDLRAAPTAETAMSDESASFEYAITVTASGDDGGVASTPRRFILTSSFMCPSGQPACNYQNAVLKYDADTGAFLGPFITDIPGPAGLAIHPIRETLIVASRTGDKVNEYNAETGAFIRTFVEAGSGGLKSPQGILFKADGNLLVTSTPSVGFLDRVNGVLEYNGQTGAFVKVFINGGPISPTLPENCGHAHCIRGPVSMAINPVNGRLYITSDVNHKILEHNAVTGAYIGAITGNPKLISPGFILMRPLGTERAGNFLVTTKFPNNSPSDFDSIIEFDHVSRSVLTFSPGSRDFATGIRTPGPMMWLHDGNLLHDDRTNFTVSPFADRLVVRNPLLGTFISNKTEASDTNLRFGTGLRGLAEGFASGDNDSDGDRDMKDFAAFMRCFGRTPSASCRTTFDDNLTGTIGLGDYRVFRRMFAGPPVPCITNSDCDDANPCTVGTCNAGDCSFTPVANGTSCSDGLFCNGEETCTNGVCVGTPPCIDDAHCDEANDLCLECLTHAECNDGNVCTTNSCVNNVCVMVNNTNPCSDGNECTVNDRCSGGVCEGGPPRVCNDGNICTTNGCDPSIGCIFINNNNPCNDGNACTVNDQCLLGTCQGGPPPVCDDGNPCTHNNCNPATGCVFPSNNNIPCDNGNACTQEDFCFNSVCQSGPSIDCDDGVFCTLDTCDDGECFHTPIDSLCDDGQFCTGVGTCDPEMNCVFSGNPCESGEFCNEDENRCDECQTHADCDDGVSCTIDECIDGICFNTPEDENCPDDGLFCTGDATCDAELDCVHLNPPCGEGPCNEALDICGECSVDEDCDDGVACTVDTCDTENSICVNTPDNELCDDGLFCNGAETCDPGLGCQAGSDPCDDGVVCTIDDCDEGTDDCTHTPDDVFCDDGNECTVCVCDASDPEADANGCVCTPVADSTACTDDGVACTVDQCIDGTCMHTPDDVFCDDGNECTVCVCDPDAPGADIDGCVCTPVTNGTTCTNDGAACTVDQCFDGTCMHTPDDGFCDDGNECTVCVCDPDAPGADVDGCVCTPVTNGTTCTDDGNACTIDQCIDGTCMHTPDDVFCDDGNECTVCVCDPGAPGADVDGCVCTPVTDGTTCTDDGFACTVSECVSGVCVDTPDDGFCDDGQFCNGAEFCDPGHPSANANGCVDGPDPVCDDGLACTIDFCDTAMNSCNATPVNTLCDDLDPCTDNICDVVLGCVFPPKDCSHLDGVCVEGACNQANGSCMTVPANEGGICDDGDLCTDLDECQGGVCVGIPADCSAFNDQCNVGVCNEGTGDCEAQPANEGNACDDGLFCTVSDTCLAGGCEGVPRDCTDLDGECVVGVCDEFMSACVAEDLTDGTPCGEDGSCFAGVCEPNDP